MPAATRAAAAAAATRAAAERMVAVVAEEGGEGTAVRAEGKARAGVDLEEVAAKALGGQG